MSDAAMPAPDLERRDSLGRLIFDVERRMQLCKHQRRTLAGGSGRLCMLFACCCRWCAFGGNGARQHA